jgi:hypothetical protein
MRRKFVLVLCAIALAAFGLFQHSATPAGAGTPTEMTFSVSNPKDAQTGVQYSWSFKTATTAAIDKITFQVKNSSGASPTGFGGTPTVVKRHGIASGSVSRSGNTITFDRSGTPTNITAGTRIGRASASRSAGSPTRAPRATSRRRSPRRRRAAR